MGHPNTYIATEFYVLCLMICILLSTTKIMGYVDCILYSSTIYLSVEFSLIYNPKHSLYNIQVEHDT